eukprot:2607006-Amphidinium_carterae.1
MHGSSHGALDVALVPEVCELLFHIDNIPNRRRKVTAKTCDIASVKRCATIRMGSGGSVRAKPP